MTDKESKPTRNPFDNISTPSNTTRLVVDDGEWITETEIKKQNNTVYKTIHYYRRPPILVQMSGIVFVLLTLIVLFKSILWI